MYRLIILLIPAFLAAQEPKASTTKPPVARPIPDSAIAILQRQLVEMRDEMERLRKEVEKHDGWFEGRDTLARLYQQKVDSVIKGSVSLDPSEKGYGTVTTDSGTFFVSLLDVEPYLDGYRIGLEIGNPYAITVTQVAIIAEWNRKWPAGLKLPADLSKYEEWSQAKRTQEFSESTELKPGSWTAVRLVLTETKSDQLGYLEVKLKIKGVRMSR